MTIVSVGAFVDESWEKERWLARTMYPNSPSFEPYRIDGWCNRNYFRDKRSTVFPGHNASRWFCKHRIDGTRAGTPGPLLYIPNVVEVPFHGGLYK